MFVGFFFFFYKTLDYSSIHLKVAESKRTQRLRKSQLFKSGRESSEPKTAYGLGGSSLHKATTD